MFRIPEVEKSHDLKMAASKRTSWKKIRETFSLKNLLKYVLHPQFSGWAMLFLFIGEVFINLLVIQKIKCTIFYFLMLS